VATVNDRGIVTCIGSGEVTITATADDGTGITDSITLTGVQGVTDFDILPGEITVYTGENAEVTVNNIQPANAVVREFTWTVSPENAAVIQDGVLTPTTASNTEAILTITSWNGVEKSIPVHIIRPEVSSIIISEVSETYVGTPVQLTARVTVNGAEYENRFIRWESSNPEIAEVDENGLVTPKAIGEVWIYAYDKVNEMNSCSIYLYPQVALEDYRIYFGSEYHNLAYTTNAIYIYGTDFTPSDANRNVIYTAQTAEGNTIEIRRNGTSGCYFYYEGPETTITVTGTSANGLVRTTTVDARYDVSELLSDGKYSEEGFIPGTKFIALGESSQLTIHGTSNNSWWIDDDWYNWKDEWNDNLKLSYASDNESIATVDENGLVTGVSKGSAQITVMHVYTGKSVTIPVRILTPVNAFDLPGRVKVPVGGNIDLPANNMQPGGTDAEDLIWQISPEGIAKVEDGKLIALSYEETAGTLTAVSINGVVRSANLTIYEPWVDSIELEEVGTVMLGDTIQLIAHVTAGEDEFINAGVKFRGYHEKRGDGDYGYSFEEAGWCASIDERTGIFHFNNLGWGDTVYIVAISELSEVYDEIEIHAQPGYENFQVKTPLMLRSNDNGKEIQINSYEMLYHDDDYNPNYDSNYLAYETDEISLFHLSGRWITPNREGYTGVGTVRVRSINGVEREVQVVVYSEDEIDSVTITGVPAYAGTYQNIPLTANLSMYGTTVQTTNELVTWNSDNPKVASVNSAGVVRTLGYGIAHITATTVNGRTDTVTIVVSKEPDNFRLPERFTVEYGNSIELQIAQVEPEDAEIDITWSVEPAEVASIEGNTLTALVKENTTATITATNWDGSTRTAILEITYTPPLTTLYLPSMLKEIEEEGFMGITAQAVIIPDGCTKIGSRAFADCPNLVYVYIPASVTSIAEDAFAGSGQVEIDYGLNE